MPYRPDPRRPLPAPLNAVQLSASIAFGLWLGFMAIALTAWLVARLLFSEQLAPVAAAIEHLATPPVVAQPVPDSPPQSPLFDQYEENLRRNEQQQRLDQARSSQRNLANPKCQFWLQQDRTAPSEKSRANVMQFCD
ncbi:hypothetical protein [Pseudomonas sp. VI4.1]|uniref:hypothetical protein n=1 Tax=Pseudomonas sp. VI4.1 TaxID=1941346 RepID=UPI0009C986D4|nr:hypothetical protein [Pseudomonas sp. VI4.1]OPK09371.1 hypothetical protein BZ163_16240 [Pseudomonas sp. VI4.1]